MSRQRMMLMCLLVLVGVLGVAGEASAQQKIFYECALQSPPNSVPTICSMNLDGSERAVLTPNFESDSLAIHSVSADGTELLISDMVGQSTYRFLRVSTVDGSIIGSIPDDSGIFGFSMPDRGTAQFVSPPPSVATLSPTNQTIAVFLLGMIASALIMRGRQGTVEQT